MLFVNVADGVSVASVPGLCPSVEWRCEGEGSPALALLRSCAPYLTGGLGA